MERKYKLTHKTIISDTGRTLRQIRAVRDFNDVKAGDLGGYIQSENNLSHDGNCWVYDEATVENSEVYGNAMIKDHAKVGEKAFICHNAVISGNAVVYGACVKGQAQINDNAKLLSYSELSISVTDNAVVSENAVISGAAVIYKNAVVRGNANISNNNTLDDVPKIYGNAVIEGHTDIQTSCHIHDNAKVSGDTKIWTTPIVISGNADIKSNDDYMASDIRFNETYQNLNMAAFKCADGSVKISGFSKTLPIDEFVEYASGMDPKHQAEYEQLGENASEYFNNQNLELSEADLPEVTEPQMQQ